MQSPTPDLVHALEALEADALVAALDRLLSAWSGHRAAETAHAIERLGKLIDRSLPPVSDGLLRVKAIEERWHDIASARRPADVTRLLEPLGVATARAMKGYFEQLGHFRPDPRIPGPAVTHASRFTSTGAGPTRTAADQLALKIADGRMGARLGNKLPPPPALDAADQPLLEAIEAQLVRLAALPAPDEASLFAAPAGAPGGDSEQDLVAAVLAAPADLSCRLVYADWLNERNHPRGELIVLQHREATGKLTGKERQRVQALCKEHGGAWIHPLDAVVDKPRFSLGFLSGCGGIRFRTKKQRHELADHPLWATVEAIDDCDDEALLLGGALRSLVALGTDAETLAKLAALPGAVPLQQASVAVREDTLEPWATIGEVGALKHLTRLDLALPSEFGTDHRTIERTDWYEQHHHHYEQTPEHYPWLLDSLLARQLTHLTFGRGSARLASWLDEAVPRLPALRRLEAYDTPRYKVGGLSSASGRTLAGSPCDVRWVLERDGDAPFRATLEIDWPYFKDALRRIDLILALNLQGFPRADLPEVTVRYVGKTGAAFDVGRLRDDLGPLLGPSFARVVLPNGA